MKKISSLILIVSFLTCVFFISAGEVMASPAEKPLGDAPDINPPGLLDQTGVEGSALNTYSFDINDIFIDDDGDSYSISTVQAFLRDSGANKLLPTWLSFAETPTGSGVYQFNGTPDQGSAGVYTIRVIAFDGPDDNYDEFTYTIEDDNHAPVVANPIDDTSLNDNQSFSFSFAADTFYDEDGDVLTYTVKQSNNSALPSWLLFNQTTRTFSGTVPNGVSGTITVRVTATDTSSATVYNDFVITLVNINYAPEVNANIPDQSATEDIAFSYTFPLSIFTDIDGDVLQYSAQYVDASPLAGTWLSFDADTRTFSGTPLNADVGEWQVRVTASDGNASVYDDFSIQVANVNDAPVVSTVIPDQTIQEDVLFDFGIPGGTFYDEDGDALTYTATLADGSALSTTGWLSFSSDTFSGTPGNDDVGSYSIKVTADDSNGGTVTDTFVITVENVNDAPSAGTIADRTLYDNDTFDFAFAEDTFTDVDGDNLTYSAALEDGSALPAWLVFTAETRTFSGTVPNTTDIVLSVRVTATDDGTPALDASTLFTITVQDNNDGPFVYQGISDQTTAEDDAFALNIPADAFDDLDGDALTYSAELEDGSALLTTGWLSFDGSAFSGAPSNDHVGTYQVRVTAQDAEASVDTTFQITVTNVNDAPEVANAITEQAATEDSAFEYAVPADTFADVDIVYGDALTLSAALSDGTEIDMPEPAEDPFWLDFDAASGTFSGTPENADAIAGSYEVRVTATDASGSSVDTVFTITVANTNDAPYEDQGIGNMSTAEDAVFTYQIAADAFGDIDPDQATDPETGDSWTYSALEAGESTLPDWLTLTGDTFSGTSDNSEVGVYDIELTIEDSGAATALTQFSITVTNVNDAPVAGALGAVPEADEDSAYSFSTAQTLFDDDDIVHGDSLSYSALKADGTALPGWLAFSVDDGNGLLVLVGTPLMADIGTHELKLVAEDTQGATVEVPFEIVVNAVNDAPQVANPISDRSTNEDDTFTYQVPSNTFSDEENDTLTYTAYQVLNAGQADESTDALPGWLGFDAATQTFSGTPENDDVGSVTLRVMVTDDGTPNESVYDDFVLTVLNTNDSPEVILALADQTIDEDTVFDISIPAADHFYDMDAGDVLTYTAVQMPGEIALPTWLVFSTDSGNLTFNGTPPQDYAGTTTIQVTSSDGSLAVSDDFVFTVTNVNDAPEVANAITEQAATEDSAFTYVVPSDTFADVDIVYGDELTLSAALSDGTEIDMPEPAEDPFWLDFDAASGTFSGTPENADAIAGSYEVRVTATDASGSSVDTVFTITVANTNDAPYEDQGIGNMSTAEDAVFTYQIAADAFGDIDPDQATDPETGDSWTYSALEAGESTLPDWLTLTGDTFSGTPDNSEVGVYDIELTIEDSGAATALTQFSITVTNVNDAPVAGVLGAVPEADEDSAYSFSTAQSLFDDDDIIHGDSLSYSALKADGTALPGWLTFSVDDGNGLLVLSGTPLMADIGTHELKLVAEDTQGATVEVPFEIVVNAVNDTPQVANPISDRSTNEDDTFTYQVPSTTFSDEENDTLTYTAYQVLNAGQADESTDALPGWLSFNGTNRIFSGTPGNDDVGSVTLRVMVTDDGTPNESVYDDFVLTVLNTNDAPQLDNEVPDQSVDEDSTASYCIPEDTFSDIDGDSLTYLVKEANETDPPDWITVENSSVDCNGLPKLSFAPLNADVGTIYLKITISDGNGGTNSDLFSVTAINTNDDPYVANVIPDFNHDEDELLDFTFSSTTFKDDDTIHGDTLDYTAVQVINAGDVSEYTQALPAWLSLSGRVFSGTPDWDDVVELTIRLTATDDAGQAASTDFTISLQMVNDIPVATGSIPAQSATEDLAFSFDLDDVPSATFQWSDEEDDLAMLALTLSADLADGEALPAWLSFDPATHVFSGTPLNDDTNQVHEVRLTATDADGGSSSTTFELEVIFVNDAPLLSHNIPDKSADEDVIFSYQIPTGTSTAIFTDEENDTLTYHAELTNGDALPDWLTFLPSSRLFYGTAENGDVGSYEIIVTATDADERVVSDIFIITVANTNDKPVLLNLIPDQSFAESDAFEYIFAANTFVDYDVSDTLSYSATLVDGTALPAWLVFEAASRNFSVAADSGEPGEYYVQITATDDGSPALSENAVFMLTVEDTPETISVEYPLIDQTTQEDSEYQFTVPDNTFLHGDGYQMTYHAELIAVDSVDLDPVTLLSTSDTGTWLRARTDNVDTIYIYGTPNNSHVGFYTIRVTAEDAYGNSNYDDYVLEVVNVNDYPAINQATGDQTATEDVAFVLDVSNLFTEIDIGDSYVIDTISVSGIGSYSIDHTTPGETQIDLGSGEYFWLAYNNDYNGVGEMALYGLPENDDVYDSQNGSYTITLTAKDTYNYVRSYSFDLNITPVNDAPVLGDAISDKTVTCGYDLYKLISETAWVDVDEDDTFTFVTTIDGSSTLPSWLTFDASSRYFHGTPTTTSNPEACGDGVAEGNITSYSMLVTLTDSGGESLTLDTFNINVRKPVSGSGSLMYITTDDSQFSDLTIYEDCVDLNGDPDANCSFDLPVDAFQNYTRTTTEDPWVRDDSLLEYAVATVDGALPSWVTPDGDSGSDTTSPYTDPLHLTFAPGDDDPGVYYLYFTATNPESDFRDNVMKLTVVNTNDAPVVQDGLIDRSATEEYSFEYVFSDTAFEDIDYDDSLTYTAELMVSGSPEPFPADFWLNFNPLTRRFSGVPSNDDVTRNTIGSVIYDGDSWTIRVTATDESGAAVSDEFTIVVNNNQDYPTVDSAVLSTFSNLTVQESDVTWSFILPDDVCTDVDQPYNDVLDYDTVKLLDGSALSTTGWLTYDTATRTFDGTPEYENVGNYFVRVYCKDLTNRTANFYFTITVENVNDHPVVANPIPDTPKNAYEDTFFYYQAPANTFSDEEDNDLIYSAYWIDGGTPSALPAWLSFDSATRFFSSEDTDTQDPPSNDDVGTYQIRLCVDEDLPADENPGTACEDFYIKVNNVNDVPLVDDAHALPDQSTDEDVAYSYQINQDAANPTFYDIDIGDSLSFAATLADSNPLPAWLALSGDTLSGTPVNEDVGTYYIKVIATDNSGVQTSDIYVLDVINVNDTPTVENPIDDKVATEDQLFTYTVPKVNATGGVFADIDNAVYSGETHTFYACDSSTACACDGSDTLAAWLTFSGRILSGTPNYPEEGHHNISITVCDAENAYAYDTFDLQVVLANDAPLVANAIDDQETDEDSPYSFTFADNVFSDEEGDVLTYSAVEEGSASLPAWLDFDDATRTFSSIADRPDYMDIGSVDIVVRATDTTGDYVEDVFTLTVNAVNDTPVLNEPISDRNVYEEAIDSYQISSSTFIDEEGDTLTYSLTLDSGDPLPAWITFNPSTRILETRPQNEHADQTFALLLTVTDDGTPNRSNSTTFNIITHDVNDAPTVNDPIDDMTIIEDIETHFIIPDGSGSDPATFYEMDNNDTLSFSASLSDDSALPGWIQFVAADREFIFSPTNDHVGTANAILVKATAVDSHGASAADIFKVTVQNVNDTPIRNGVIALNDQNATEDTPLSMVVNANTFTDIDPGDSITYSATLDDGSLLSSTGWLSFNSTTRTFSGTPLNAHVGTITVKLIATDQSGAANNSAFDTFDITVANTNDGPTVSQTIPNQTATEDVAFSYTFVEEVFNDVDSAYGDTLSYSAVENGETSLPGWLSFDGATRTFSGTPTNDDTSTYTIQVTADDGDETVSTTFNITVTPVNDAPHDIDLSSSDIDENMASATVIGTLSASDVDNTSGFIYSLVDGSADNARFSISGNSLRSAESFDFETHATLSVDIRVTDTGGLSYDELFTITINDLNETPVLSGESIQLDEGDVFNSLNLLDNDYDPDPADNITVSSIPDDVDHGVLNWNVDGTFEYTHDGSETTADGFTYEVCDDDATTPLCDTAAVTITIDAVNDTPLRNGAVLLDDQTAYEDSPFVLDIAANTFTDAEDSTLTYSAVEDGQSDLPGWLSFDPATRRFSGTPAQSDLGTYTIRLAAEDSGSLSASDTFDITVVNTNDAPYIANAIADQYATEDNLFSYTLPAGAFADIDPGDSLSYSAVQNSQASMPVWLAFDTGTLVFSGTPTNDEVGTWSIAVTATDLAAATATDTFDITVVNTNDAPTLANAIPDQTATEDIFFSYGLPANTFADVDVGDSLSCSATQTGESSLPAWLSFNTSTCVFSGTPGNDDIAVWPITVTAVDGSGASATDSFNITVIDANDAPYLVVEIPDQSTTEDVLFTYQFPAGTFNDIDPGDVLSYSAVQSGQGLLPAWLSFDSASRTFSGTPANDHVGTWSITVTAYDLAGSYAADTFTITVDNVNDVPQVDAGISDQVAYEDSSFIFFLPSDAFADVDTGDSLTYEMVGEGTLAAWLNFNAGTGRFYGTPLNEHIGTNAVHVTARDGSNTTVTTSFNLTVQPVNDPPYVVTPVEDVIPLNDREATEENPFSLSISISAVFGDEEFDPLTLTATMSDGSALPGWLTFSATADPDIYTITGTPGNDDVGVMNVKVIADDGNGGTVSDTFEMDVINVNDAPEANDMTVAAFEKVDKLINFDASDIDPTGDTLTCYIESLPTGGELYLTTDGVEDEEQITVDMLPAEVTDCMVIYNTQVDFSDDVPGYDQFTYSAHDGMLPSAADGTVTINIRNSNNDPTAIDLDHTTIDENNSVNQLVGTFSATDIDAVETFAFSLVEGAGSADNDDFTINGDGELRAAVVFNYEESREKHIRVQAMDSGGGTYSTTFVIDINDVNEMIESITLSNNIVPEGLPAGQVVGYFDIQDPDEGDSWTVDLTHVDGSSAGSLSPVPFVVEFHGGVPLLKSNEILNVSTKAQYVLTFDFTDSGGLLKTQAFTIEVYRLGDDMVVNDVVSTSQETSVTVDVLGNDNFSPMEIISSGDSAGWFIHSILIPPSHGTARIGSIIYTPDAGYVGTDQVVYLACDNSLYCGYGTVDIVVTSDGTGSGSGSPGTTTDDDSTADGASVLIDPLTGKILPGSIPASGFAPGVVTTLEPQPDGIYQAEEGMWLSIPSMGINTRIVGVPLIDGQWDITWLGNDAGFLEGSAFPTTDGNTVITGHVWNADGSMGILLGLEALQYGDKIVIQNNGWVYTYEVREVVEYLPADKVAEVFRHEELDWLTLFTCQQYDEDRNTYNYRILARAVLVDIQ